MRRLPRPWAPTRIGLAAMTTDRDQIIIVRASMSLLTVAALGAAGLGATALVWLDGAELGGGTRALLLVVSLTMVLASLGLVGRAIQGWRAIVGGAGWLQRHDPWWFHRIMPNSRLEGDLSNARLEIEANTKAPLTPDKASGITRVMITTDLGYLRTYGKRINADVRERFEEWQALQPAQVRRSDK